MTKARDIYEKNKYKGVTDDVIKTYPLFCIHYQLYFSLTIKLV